MSTAEKHLKRNLRRTITLGQLHIFCPIVAEWRFVIALLRERATPGKRIWYPCRPGDEGLLSDTMRQSWSLHVTSRVDLEWKLLLRLTRLYDAFLQRRDIWLHTALPKSIDTVQYSSQATKAMALSALLVGLRQHMTAYSCTMLGTALESRKWDMCCTVLTLDIF